MSLCEQEDLRVEAALAVNDRRVINKRSCALENQKSVSKAAIMSDMVVIGDYELMEKQNDRYKQQLKQLDIESGLTSTKHAIGIRMRLY